MSLSKVGGAEASLISLNCREPMVMGASRAAPPAAAAFSASDEAVITPCMFSMGVMPHTGSLGNVQP